MPPTSNQIIDSTLEDLESFYLLDQAQFKFPWKSRDWENISLSKNEHFLAGIYKEESLIGFILFKLTLPHELAHLFKILISKESRKQGLGDQLLGDAIRKLRDKGFKRFYLEVESNNNSAQKLYGRHNFKVIHHKKKFYSNGQDATIMQCILS
jgi:[ribosomal protein S18]-alanine N-acetyltransferase